MSMQKSGYVDRSGAHLVLSSTFPSKYSGVEARSIDPQVTDSNRDPPLIDRLSLSASLSKNLLTHLAFLATSKHG